jgi:hypothetical protein
VAQYFSPPRTLHQLPIGVFLSNQELLIDSPCAKLELSLAIGRGTVVTLPCDEGTTGAAEVAVVTGDDLVVCKSGRGGRSPSELRGEKVEEVDGEGAGLLAALGAEAD